MIELLKKTKFTNIFKLFNKKNIFLRSKIIFFMLLFFDKAKLYFF